MIDRLVRRWSGEDAGSVRQTRVLAAVLGVICFATLLTGVPRLRIYGHDVFMCLDGAWRVLNGQRPAADFHAMTGPAWYLLHAGGLAVARNAARGLGYATTFTAVALSLWSWLLLRRRMEAAPLQLACATIVLLAVAPFPLGEYPWATGFAMGYNRYGYALTALVLLECFLPLERAPAGRRSFFGGLSTGLACSLLLFLKVSFGLVALTLAWVSLLVRRAEQRRAAGLAAGFVAVLLPMLVYLRFDASSVIREYSMLAKIRAPGVSFPAVVIRVYENAWEIMPVILLLLLVATLPGLGRRRSSILVIAGAMAAVGGVLLGLTNLQWGRHPLTTAVALLALNEVTRLSRRNQLVSHHALALIGLGLLCVGIPLAMDGGGVLLAAGDPLIRPKTGYRLKPPHLAALEFYDLDWAPNDNGRSFVEKTSEGFELITANSDPSETVLGAGFVNPFSYGLMRPPPEGGAVSIHESNVSDSVAPPRELLIGNPDVLLVPRFGSTQRKAMWIALRSDPDLLDREYLEAAASPNWKLYRRR